MSACARGVNGIASSSVSIGIKGGIALGTIETDDELNIEHRRGTKEVGTGVTMELDDLDVPLLVRVGSSSANDTRFHVFTGPLAWTAGVGIEMRGWTIDGRYTLGLTNVDDSSAFDEFTNRTISVMIGYRLR